jgi:hypothetical protein
MSDTTLICGNTYPVKDALRAIGGRWDAALKGWRVPAAKAAEAQALVSGAAKSTVVTTAGKCAKCGRACKPQYRTCYDCSSTSRGSSRSSSRSYGPGKWTGCSCGSREDTPRPSDCSDCRFENEDQ